MKDNIIISIAFLSMNFKVLPIIICPADHLAGVKEQEPANSVSQSPANNFPSIPRPSAVAVIPHREEVNTLPLSHPENTPTEHAYESLKEMEDAVTEGTDSSGYQTVEELNGSSPSLSDHMQEAGSSASTAVEGWEEGEMYAQVSRKHRKPTQPGEPVSLPQQLLKKEEEEDPAPPVPYRSLEI